MDLAKLAGVWLCRGSLLLVSKDMEVKIKNIFYYRHLILTSYVKMTGIVNYFLSWGLWTPLARMTYIVYLVHIGVIISFFYSMNYSVELTDLIASFYYIGIIMVCYGIGFVGTVSFESPFIRLEKLILGRKNLTHTYLYKF